MGENMFKTHDSNKPTLQEKSGHPSKLLSRGFKITCTNMTTKIREEGKIHEDLLKTPRYKTSDPLCLPRHTRSQTLRQ